MIFRKLFASAAVLGMFALGCDTNPIDSTGGDSLPTAQSPVSDNHSNPGVNPGDSGISPHPEATEGTVLPTDPSRTPSAAQSPGS
jgi:hypothetical protein